LSVEKISRKGLVQKQKSDRVLVNDYRLVISKDLENIRIFKIKTKHSSNQQLYEALLFKTNLAVFFKLKKKQDAKEQEPPLVNILVLCQSNRRFL